MRIGHGYDAHRFCENKPLVIGGVNIEYDLGLLAHSDGDVLVHSGRGFVSSYCSVFYRVAGNQVNIRCPVG